MKHEENIKSLSISYTISHSNIMHIVNRSPWSPNSLKTNMLINMEVMQKKKIIIISLSWVVLYRLTTKLPPMRCVLFSIRTEESHDDKAEDTCSFGPNTEKKCLFFCSTG